MKKVMKALALALALCMVLSVSAFASVGETGKTVDTDDRTVTFTVTGLAEGEQVALLVLRDGATLETASESNILYIDQKAVATGETSVGFTATIADSTEDDDNSVVDVYVGSESINKNKSGAWTVYENVEVAETSSIELSETAAIYLNIDEEKGITRPGAAIGVNVKNKAINKMIWVLKVDDNNRPYRFSKAVDINVAESLEGEVWFTGVFSSTALDGLKISEVAAIFRDADGATEYYMGTKKEDVINYKVTE